MTLALIFATATHFFDLPPHLLEAVCYVESEHDVLAINKKDGKSPSYGICQVKYETAKELGFNGTREQLMLPNRNIYYAAKYLRKQMNRYNGRTCWAVQAYNRGSAHDCNGRYVLAVLNKWRDFND